MKRRNLLIISILAILSSCLDDDDATTSMEQVNPPEFGEAVYHFDQNPLSEEGFALGRALFYDPILSKDSTVSCASCHQQAAAFADAGKPVSIGIDGRSGIRNSPTIFNHRWYPMFFWDGGGNHIELVPHNALTSENEMGEDLSELFKKLNAHPTYPPMFERVFKKTPINSQQLFFALAQFTGSMVSYQSKFDLFKKGKSTLTPSESIGYELFKTNCASCHTEPLFTNFAYENNGLDSGNDADLGRQRITLKPSDAGKFRVPTLRNVAVTAPYMHDGRLATLEAVLEHYTHNIHPSPTLSPLLQQQPIALSSIEQQQLIAFLKTLTDESFLNDPRFKNPF